MPTPSSLPRKALTAFAIVIVFSFCLIQSLATTVAWWRGDLVQPNAWDWLWIGLMPVCLFVYIPYFSIFRAGCGAYNLSSDRPKSPSC
jgi:hypothetical protein